MIRVVIFLLAVGIAAFAVAWFAERPGEVAITWMDWRIETSLAVLVGAVAALGFVLVLLWTLVRLIFRTPRLAAAALRERRRRKGQRALSRGLIALASGDMRTAQRFSSEASRNAAEEPLTLLLQAQTAQVAGDRAAADAAFRAMTERPETRLLGLRGLFVEAERRGDQEAAGRFAEEAATSAPALPWAGQAVLDFRCAAGDWRAALEALETNMRGGLIERATYRRRRAVLLTARALDIAETDPAAAKALAFEAAKLAPDLVPAATLAARLAAESGEWRRGARLLDAAWRHNPHPDIADLYVHLRAGNSARDRLARARILARAKPGECEGTLALARAAIDAQEFTEARTALAPHLDQPTQRVALLMAQLEEREFGDAGRQHEWMGRALRAARDPVWTADGIVSDRWLPVSPATGRLDAFTWRVPVAELGQGSPWFESASAPLAREAAVTQEADVEDAIVADEPTAATSAATEGAPAEQRASSPPDQAPHAAGTGAAATTAAAATGFPASVPAAAPSSGRPGGEPRRAAIIPLMRAPDDPGPDPDPAEPVLREADGAARAPYR